MCKEDGPVEKKKRKIWYSVRVNKIQRYMTVHIPEIQVCSSFLLIR